jgi:glycosyltransferase involved in cell wall biosynthesis
MAIPETDSRESGAANADAGLATTVTIQHHGSTLAQPAPGGLSIAVSVQSILAEQSNEVGPWIIPGPYASGQAATHSLRILVVATEAPPVRSGIARIVGYLRDGFQERGHHVDVLAYPEVGRLVFGEVRLSSLIFKLPQLLRRINEYDIIHVHGTTPTFSDVALLFTRLRGPHPMVIYTHHVDLDFGPRGFLNRIYNHLHHRLSAQADAVIASTQDNLSLLGSRCRGFVIPFGIDLEHFSTNGRKNEQFTVLFIGQFRPYKGVRVLLQAMAQVTGARLLLAGQGPEEQAYRSLGAELGLDVEFHIGIDDDQLRQLYQQAHAVVVPSVSRLEAFGLALVEGMAAGCVPIASDLPGVREVVGQTGFLFPKGDANRLAGILRGLRDDPALVQQIGDRARVRAAGFSRARTICEYEGLITGLIACRDLKDLLAEQAQSYASAFHTFTTNVARDLDAHWTEIVLHLTQDELYPVVLTRSTRLWDHRRFQRASSLLAWHAINTGDSTLVGPNDGPLHLRNMLARGMPAAMVTPLTVEGERFGALLSMRGRPFDQHDLSNLTCFARSAAPSLLTLTKRSVVGG